MHFIIPLITYEFIINFQNFNSYTFLTLFIYENFVDCPNYYSLFFVVSKMSLYDDEDEKVPEETST